MRQIDANPVTDRSLSAHSAIRHALSFDIEDWFHIVQVKGLEHEHWDDLTKQHTLVERRTNEILEICEEAGVKATFFVLGWIAERYPSLLQRIAQGGHELASHGHMHDRVGLLGPGGFAQDLKRSIEAIGSACGVRVRGYRAPVILDRSRVRVGIRCHGRMWHRMGRESVPRIAWARRISMPTRAPCG